jgi:hypothetical protein
MKVIQMTKLIREVIKEQEKFGIQNSKSKYNLNLDFESQDKISEFLMSTMTEFEKKEIKQIDAQELQEILDKNDQ